MLKIYDGRPLTLQDGEIYTKEQLAEKSFFKPLVSQTSVINETDGITTSFWTLANMKAMYGVTEDDPEAALAEIINIRASNEDIGTIERDNIQQQLNEQAEAIMELAAILTEGE